MSENEVSRIVIGEAIKVHSSLGPGLLESVYEECLCYVLGQSGLSVQRQKPIPLVYKGVKLDCGFRCDILVDEKLIVEVKAVEAFNEVHLAQVLTYLRLSDIRLGVMINFNVAQLKDGLKRVVNKL